MLITKGCMKNNFKCCMVTSTHDAFDDRMFYKEAISLKNAGYEVCIIAPVTAVHQDNHGVAFCFYDRTKSLQRGYGLNKFLHWARIVWLGMKVDADVYHCHEFELLFPAFLVRLGQKVLRRRRTFVIHEIRDFYLSDAHLDHNLGRWQKIRIAILEYLDRIAQRMCDFIIGVEETKVERVHSYGISPERIFVIENYVRPDLFPMRRKKFDPNNFVVGYSGGISFYRGVDRIAKACVALGTSVGVQITLLLAGRWISMAERKKIFDYCFANKKYITLKDMGWIPHTEVSSMLEEVDVCCAVFFSKRYEKVLNGKAGPIKLYEYMASGKPIVASNLEALKHTIKRSQCGIIVDIVDGEKAIAEALEYYFKNPKIMTEHGLRGRAAAEQLYSWDIAEKKLLRLYEGIYLKADRLKPPLKHN